MAPDPEISTGTSDASALSTEYEHDPMPGVSKTGYALNVLYTTASRLRAMCDGGDWDLGLREAAAFIEFKVAPEVRGA